MSVAHEKLIKKYKPSICLILMVDKSTNQIISGGSGFLYKFNDKIATCNHVINKQNCEIQVKFPDTPFKPATVYLTNQMQDLALLQVENIAGQPLQPIAEFDSREGQDILFMGYPQIATFSAHTGIISSLITDASKVQTIQIDGTINSGNSGGPVINLKGDVIGVVNATRRERSDLLKKVEQLDLGEIKIHDLDLIEINQSIIKNLQMGVGYAVPIKYMPEIPIS